jgi:hypothetical protein
MTRSTMVRRLAACSASTVALVGLGAGTAGAGARITFNPAPDAHISVAPATVRTFSFIGKPGGPTKTVFSIDSLLINARCDSGGNPIVFAFSLADSADLYGRFFDARNVLHLIGNSSFTKTGKGVQLTPSRNDFHGTGMVLFEVSTGTVVTVNYAFDNSTTLSKQNVCTAYGSLIAT